MTAEEKYFCFKCMRKDHEKFYINIPQFMILFHDNCPCETCGHSETTVPCEIEMKEIKNDH